MNTQITVKVVNFKNGPKYARQFGGKFDPASKTWTIPTHRNGVYNNALNGLGLYGLQAVTKFDETHDHNCPAHFGNYACECKEN